MPGQTEMAFIRGNFCPLPTLEAIGANWGGGYFGYFYEGVSEDMILLDHDVNMGLHRIGLQ